MKTIKQIADSFGVSKQAIRRHLDKIPPTELSTGEHNSILISEEGERIIEESMRNVGGNIDGNIDRNVTMPYTVDEQLREKDRLIAELQKRNGELQLELVEVLKKMGTLADQAQHLQAQSQKALTDGKMKRRWWQRKTE